MDALSLVLSVGLLVAFIARLIEPDPRETCDDEGEER